METATSDASTAATALTTKLNEPLNLADVLVKDVGTIGPSDCSQANSNARGSACQASSCNLAPTIQNRIDTVRAEYLDASWVKFDKDALLSTAVTEESHSMGEFQGDVTATANNYHSMCGNSDQVHDTAVTLFNDNNAGRSTMYQSLGVILCHINHMSSSQTYNVPTDLLKSGEANPTTSASDCKDKLKSDTTIKADLFPDASSDEDSNKVCPALSAYEDDIRNYGGLGFDKDESVWSPESTNCAAVTAHVASGAPTTPGVQCGAFDAAVSFVDGCGMSSTTWTSGGSQAGVTMDINGLSMGSSGVFFDTPNGRSVNYNIGPDAHTELSIEIWFKETAPFTNGNTYIIGHDNGGFDRAITIHDNAYRGVAAPHGSTYSSTLGYPSLNQWYHVVATFNQGQSSSGNTVFLRQLGGALQSQALPAIRNNGAGETSFTVGGLKNYGNHNAHADVAVVRVFEKILTEAEVNNLYDSRPAGLN